MILLMIAALASAAAEAPSEPRLLNLTELVSSEDYPDVAIRRGEEGTVQVQLSVNRDGLTTGCTVIHSSGSEALDARTCAIFRDRARFETARDRRGKPVASTSRQRLTWKLEVESPPTMLRQPWMFQTVVSMDREGRIVGCKANVVDAPFRLGWCEYLEERAGALQTTFAPAEAFASAITQIHFYPTAPEFTAVPRELDGATMARREVARVFIAPDGRVSKCEAVRSSGAALSERDLCTSLVDASLTVAINDDAPALVGTVVQTDYVRMESAIGP